MIKDLPSPELLRKLLRYEPETGKLFWRERKPEMFSKKWHCDWWNGRYSGQEAFKAQGGRGYYTGAVFKRPLRAHRVIWAIYWGKWPRNMIDHISGDKKDNRISNLREATCSQNMHNRGAYKNNTSGFKGVRWKKSCKKWAASITMNGKEKHLGYYESAETAHKAYCQAARERHGKFSRV